MTLTVDDKDGGKGTDTATFTVLGSGETPPPPPPPPPAPVPICDPNITLDYQEKAFLDLLNEYRIQSGLFPPEAPSGLTKASQRHASDMSVNNFLDHIGSDSSTPEQRAEEEGYTGGIIGENLASGIEFANNLMFGFKASPGHNQIMLDPLWNTVGIAREEGSQWYWATDFGEFVDRPTALAAPGEETVMLASATHSGVYGPAGLSPDAMVLSSATDDVADAGPVSVVSTPAIVRSSAMEVQGLVTPQQMAPVFPPIAALVISNVAPQVGEEVVFTNASRDSNGALIAATLDTGDVFFTANMAPGGTLSHTYLAAGELDITLTALDSLQVSSTLVRTITVAEAPAPPPEDQDFSLTLSPSTQLLAPDKTAYFIVSVASINGFESQVDLTVTGAPEGYVSELSPVQVIPSATPVLSVTAPADAVKTNFLLKVTAVSGEILHETEGSVTVDFGLVPICKGTLAGTVFDLGTGKPIPNAEVRRFPWLPSSAKAVADDMGNYVMTNLSLGADNDPLGYTLRSFTPQAPNSYWSGQSVGFAVCGAVTIVDFQMTPMKFAKMSGNVFVGIPDPDDLSTARAVTPSDTPVENATVSLSSFNTFKTDADGFYESDLLTLDFDNEPKLNGNVQVDALGYWKESNPPVLLEADTLIVEDYAIVPRCTADISGTLTFGDTGLPVNLLKVQVTHPFSFKFSDFTDVNGEFSLPDVLLGFNNASVTYKLKIPAIAGYKKLEVDVFVERCEDSVVLDLVLPALISNFGAMQGHVIDVKSGDPMPDVLVSFSGFGVGLSSTKTEADGSYLLEDVFLGFDQQTSVSGTASTNPVGYWGDSKSVTLFGGQTATVDFEVLKKRFGFIEGTVTDAASGDHIDGASTGNLHTTGLTDSDGHYMSLPLHLNVGNTPRLYGYNVSATGYWSQFAPSKTVKADETTVVDLELIPICQGATISGRVVNALTQDPIGGAFIQVSSVTGSGFDTTDQLGNYLVDDVTVGTNNSPSKVNVKATKSGFITQFKSVSIFCGASIVLDFGEGGSQFGNIEGTVTEAGTSQPIAGAFVGVEFGQITSTDTLGHYVFSDVPLGEDDADRVWKVTASADGFGPQTKSVTATVNGPTQLDFIFGIANGPPALTPIPDQVVQETNTLDVEIIAVDPDDDSITLTVENLPSFASFTDDGDGTGTISIVPALNDKGLYRRIEVTASDGSLVASLLFSLTVQRFNLAPIADAGGPYVALEGITITLDATGSSDPDGDPLTYS